MIPFEQLAATMNSLESRLTAVEHPHIQALMQDYAELKPDFASELADAREWALSCTAALMLIKTRAEHLDALPKQA